ncbi:MAG: translocation/assembly module TamB [Gemmatimonadales bacterium]|nr:MAG: translocation/assembly module TamB [Gemmatimonadales bacterium]
MRRAAWVFWISFLVLLLVVTAGVVFLLQTGPGQQFVLRSAVDLVDRQINGTLRVEGIRSAGLLRGLTLDGISIHDPEGRPFLEADSARVGYSIRALLSRDVILEPVEVWRPRIIMETLPGDTLSNVQRIFATAPRDPLDPEVEPAPPNFRLELRRADLHDGTLTLRTPDAEPSIFSGIDARIRHAVLLDPDTPGERIVFDRLALTGELGGIGEGPFRVEEFRGEVRRVGTRLEVDADPLRLAGTRLDGTLALDWADGLALELDVEADPFRARDLAWLDPRIPDAEGRFLLLAEGPVESGTWRFDAVEIRTDRDRVSGRFAFQLGEELRILESDVQAELHLSLLDPWLEAPLPVQGRVRGGVRLAGPLNALRLDGSAIFDDPERGVPPSEARVTGVVDSGTGTVTGLDLRVDPLRLETLRAFLPDSELALVGGGSLVLQATGNLDRGLDLQARLVHSTAVVDMSEVSAVGRVRREGGELYLDLDTTLDPISFGGVERATGLDLPVEGTLRGDLRLVGLLSDLTASGSLETAGGPLQLMARLDVTEPARGYLLEGESSGLQLDAFLRAAPEGSTLAGRFRVEGVGFDPATLRARAEVFLDESSWGQVVLNAGELQAVAEEGRLRLLALELVSPLGLLEGTGDLALSAEAPAGEVALRWSLADMSALRPLLLGQEQVDPDTLSAIERTFLEMEGVDDDPTTTVALRGSAEGTLRLAGGIDDLAVELDLTGSGLAWQETEVESAEVRATARIERTDVGLRVTAIGGDARLESAAWGRFQFEEVALRGDGTPEAFGVRVDLRRNGAEAYLTEGVVVRDGARVEYRVADLLLDLDDVRWRLSRPSVVSWEEGRIAVADLEVTRPADNGLPVAIRVDGSVELDGPLALNVEASGVDLARLGSILQLEPAPEGILDMELAITGVASAPLAEGRFLVTDLLYADTRLSRMAGTLQYADEQALLRLEVDQNGNRLLTASGSYPVNLAFGDVETRFPAREVDLVVEIDDLPLATALGPLEVFDGVTGTLDGRVELRGQPADVRPSGSLRLRGGGFSLPEIGLAPSDIEAAFTVTPDGLVAVEAQARSVGPVQLSGVLDLSVLTNPVFDLEARLNGFQAVNRRDLEGRVSGTIFLRGSYMEPRVTGSIRVDQANLFLDEFARSAEVIDLTDPLFFERSFLGDMDVDALRPELEAARNPFLDNLRVDADLSIPRDVWLRSREMNVEIGGDLIVTFDRRDREILLVGQVQALRGNYNAFGRQFAVRSGTVDFVGTPGINPNLNIEAVHRLRQQGGDPLDIVASLEGTLLGMRISLTSDAAVGISESDLISYLVFGRPSYALGAAESRMLGDAAISAGIGAAAGQLSTLLGQQVGLDFFSITQAQDAGGGFAALSSEGLVDTQVELGQYVTDNIFLALVLRPLRGIGGSQAQIPGARVEWRFTDLWTFNAYVEDRFGREGVFTFGEAGLQVNRIFGLELFRDWGY